MTYLRRYAIVLALSVSCSVFTPAVNSQTKVSTTSVENGPLAPGGRVAGSESQSEPKLRAPDEADSCAQIRLAAEAAKTAIEFKPCQNLSNYELPFKVQRP
jgi:predicted secreted protein